MTIHIAANDRTWKMACQQVVRALIQGIEVRIGRRLLDDEDRLAKAQRLVQQRPRKIAEAIPFEPRPVANLHAALRRSEI